MLGVEWTEWLSGGCGDERGETEGESQALWIHRRRCHFLSCGRWTGAGLQEGVRNELVWVPGTYGGSQVSG